MNIRLYDEWDLYKNDIQKEGFGDNTEGKVDDSNNYKGVMKDSVFAGFPRGDLLFSYLFLEIMSTAPYQSFMLTGGSPCSASTLSTGEVPRE